MTSFTCFRLLLHLREPALRELRPRSSSHRRAARSCSSPRWGVVPLLPSSSAARPPPSARRQCARRRSITALKLITSGASPRGGASSAASAPRRSHQVALRTGADQHVQADCRWGPKKELKRAKRRLRKSSRAPRLAHVSTPPGPRASGSAPLHVASLNRLEALDPCKKTPWQRPR